MHMEEQDEVTFRGPFQPQFLKSLADKGSSKLERWNMMPKDMFGR